MRKLEELETTTGQTLSSSDRDPVKLLNILHLILKNLMTMSFPAQVR